MMVYNYKKHWLNEILATMNNSNTLPTIRNTSPIRRNLGHTSGRCSSQEVVGRISFAGQQATTGGSVEHLQSRYVSASRTKTLVQTSVSEGQKVWVIAWSSQAGDLCAQKHPKTD